MSTRPFSAALAFGLGAACAAQSAVAQGQGPCAQIRAACEQAGFAQGAAREGNGILADCVRPIMQGTPQPRRANLPLPQVDPQLVDACKERNPGFGEARGAQGARQRAPSQEPGGPPNGQPPAATPPR
jgi:hypothetical protein